MSVIIDGKKISSQIRVEIAGEVKRIKNVTGKCPSLAVVIAGEDSASKIYVNSKKKACEELGIKSSVYELPMETTENELLRLINKLNSSKDVHGILVQLPLPKHISEEKITEAVLPVKDVDGFHPVNVGNLSIGRSGHVSCTPNGVMELIKRYGIDVAGKHCVILGRSNIVGKPMAALMLRENATVTVCHSKTNDLEYFTKNADILIAAIGKPNFVKPEMVKENSVLIDVGINRGEGRKIYGDIDFGCAEKAFAITPVPGGVGPMTIAMLMKNCVNAFKMQENVTL